MNKLKKFHNQSYTPSTLMEFIVETIGETAVQKARQAGITIKPYTWVMDLIHRWGSQSNVTNESLEQAKQIAEGILDEITLWRLQRAGLVIMLKSDYEFLVFLDGCNLMWDELVNQLDG